MSKIRFIGDVHGRYGAYKKIIADSPPSIQVGDMGVGFRHWPHGEPYANPPHHAMFPDHRFIRGNHDNPVACHNQSQWIRDGHVENGMMFIGGGVSVDKAFRVEDYSWWPDEELSIAELNELTDKYIAVKPRIMVTHDCPEEVAVEMARIANRSYNKLDWPSRTRQALQSMWSAHSPEIWLYGHWHTAFDHALRGTRFICLPELAHVDIDI